MGTLEGIEALTLDWYGTLVEGGTDRLVDLLRGRLHARPLDFERALNRREALIASLESMPFMRFQARDEWILGTLYREFGLAGEPAHDAALLKQAHMIVSAYPDAREFLERVRDLPVYVVSNADEDMLHAGLRQTGLRVKGVVTSERARAYKPSPRIFEAAAREIGLPPERILHVGDSYVADVVGAKRAGLSAAWVQRTGLPKPANAPYEPDLAAPSLREIASALGY